VESVAWAAERKDVLAAFLGMLVLAAHLGAVRRPTAARRALVAVLLALGLMAKPMLVTIPLVLLLLDAWPFGRLRAAADLPALLAEKVPLFVLAILSSAVTLAAQSAALVPMDVVPFPARLANAAVSAVWGVGATLWPADLGIYYPLAPRGPVAPAIAGATLGLVLAAAAAATALRRRPSLAVGLCWYLVMLVPVSGLVQVGLQARADRYTYLPSAGLCIAGAWFAWSVAAGDRRRRLLVAGGCAAVALAWGLAAARQLSFWADGEALFGHTLTVTGENLMARYGLANELAARGREAEALAQFELLAAARPDFADVRYHLGLSLQRTGDARRAEQEYRAALSLDPGHHGAANNLGVLLFDDGGARGAPLAAAVAFFRRAVALRPDWAEGRRNLARALRKAGDGAGAEREYRAALALEPANAEARNNLGILLAERGDLRGATEQFLQVLRERPDQREARANLERAHALSGR
ncbi:MAG TPA: tetratricopeptide repeat protein, partial [bacterium]